MKKENEWKVQYGKDEVGGKVRMYDSAKSWNYNGIAYKDDSQVVTLIEETFCRRSVCIYLNTISLKG
ncbi:hypothetical protein [Sporosarcina psychrophila]|uniref:Holliday junction resolvase RusA-like endonuclease n=1 Tax=Sporosarcina psychrophila TaxID=1476 RepID=A0ABV2KG92_SPOPS